nr:DUF5799 family protein [Haladaptatus sp. W1]
MSGQRWTDMIVGDRMAVDREFAQEVADSNSRARNGDW